MVFSHSATASACLHYQDQALHFEDVSLALAAEQYATPLYLYSQHQLLTNWQRFTTAFATHPNLLCYAVKANSNIHLLKLLVAVGAGFDIVSGGELERVLLAGAKPEQIIFSGVGKTQAELSRAIEIGIHCINIESAAELQRISQLASQLQIKVRIALRINPNIDALTHAYIATGLKDNKFGIEINEAKALCQDIINNPHLQLIGIACHIGSQITTLEPFSEASSRMLELYEYLQSVKAPLEHLDLGGGLGIPYQSTSLLPTIEDYAHAILSKLKTRPIRLILEPGRVIIANAGVLLTRVDYIKATPDKRFAIVDAGMTELVRPALYQAWHNILPVYQRETRGQLYDVVGPVCESADFLGKDRLLNVAQGDLLAITDCGAYGFCLASNYNARLKPAEVLIHQHTMRLIRQRETLSQQLALEML